MPATLVLAQDITQANRYARALGLEPFSYRAVRNAASIRGVRSAEVHLLSTFLRRPDRHRIMSELRLARYLEVLYVEVSVGRNGSVTIVDPDNPVFEGPTDEDIEAAYAEHLERTAAAEAPEAPAGHSHPTVVATEESDEQTSAPEPSEDPASAEKPKRAARRRRCADCNSLVALEDMDAHVAEKHSAPEPAAGPAGFGF